MSFDDYAAEDALRPVAKTASSILETFAAFFHWQEKFLIRWALMD